MPEGELLQNGPPISSVEDPSHDLEGKKNSEIGNNNSPQKNEVAIPPAEEDQVASLIEEESDAQLNFVNADSKKEGNAKFLKPLDTEAEKNKEAATIRLIDQVNQANESEDQVVQALPPAEQKAKRVELKKEYVKEQRREGRQRVAESTVVLVDEDTAQRREEKLQQRQTIEQDLATVDTNALYRQYFAVLKGDQADRPRQLRMLESSLGESLKTAAKLRGAGENAYSEDTIHDIFLGLTNSQEVERMTVTLYQDRMRVALEIDQKLGTKVSDKIQEVFRSDLPADEKLRTVDALLDRLAQIKTQDKDLQKQLEELGALNKTQDEANSALQIQLVEEHVKTESRKEETRATIDIINKNFPTMPEADIRLFSDGVQTGRFELVSAMLQGTLQKMPDGSYEGTVESEKVYIAQRDGKLVASLRYRTENISIPLTDPNAVGFDLARSVKIAKAMECDDLCAREDIRWALMDGPGDSAFMDERNAEKFQTMLHVIIGENGVPAEPALRSLSLLRENRTVDQKYVGALKRCFDAWAPNGNFRDLFNVITKKDLHALVDLWKAEEEGRVEESQTLKVYTLEQIRSGQEI